MRVALDEQIFVIQKYGGISRMFAELASQFAGSDFPDMSLQPLHAPIVNRYVLEDSKLSEHLKARSAKNQYSALLRYMSRLNLSVDADIVHNTFYLPHGLTPARGAKRIVTVHDMIPELLPSTRRRLDFLTLKRRYVESADHIVCVSESTKEDLLKVYGVPSAPISVVYHGVDPRFHPDIEKLDFLPERYILFVGNRDGYKDAKVLFRAFAELSLIDSTIELLCVGGAGLSAAEVKFLEELGVRDRVAQRHLDDLAMVSAYAHAEIFVFPSHFEGFGIPALEAMACGTPVVLAQATSLPEVGGDAAAYFTAGDSVDLAAVLIDLLQDPGALADLRARGLARAAELTWHRAAQSMADTYSDALG